LQVDRRGPVIVDVIRLIEMIRRLFTVVAVACLAFVLYRASQYRGASATNVSASSANRILWTELRVPLAATDVTCRADQYGCEAKFSIDRESLLGWLAKIGSNPSPISTPVKFFCPVIMPNDDHLVTNGYEFNLRDGRGVYDANRSRASFVVSTFP
jgi:hypothetical protein